MERRHLERKLPKRGPLPFHLYSSQLGEHHLANIQQRMQKLKSGLSRGVIEGHSSSLKVTRGQTTRETVMKSPSPIIRLPKTNAITFEMTVYFDSSKDVNGLIKSNLDSGSFQNDA